MFIYSSLLQVLTASLDGQVALWDSTDGALLRVSECFIISLFNPGHTLSLSGTPMQVVDFGVPLHKLVIRPKDHDLSVFLLIGGKGAGVVK